MIVRSRLEPMVKAGKLLDYHATANELVGMVYQTKPWASQLASKMGVKRGVPDLTLRAIGPDGKGRICWIELKSEVGSLSEPQKEFRDRTQAGGWPWYLVRSLDEFDAAVKDFLS